MRKLAPLVIPFIVAVHFTSADAIAQCGSRHVYSGAFRASAHDVELDGRDLWAATSYGVALYDTSFDPPRVVTSIALPGATTRVRVLQGRAYAASGDRVFVVRKAGGRLEVAGSVSLGDGVLINDLIHVAPYLYAATSTGVVQLDLANPNAPAVATRLSTTTGRALSLARFDNFLYAADGDNTVEIYSIQLPSFPQKVNVVGALRQSTSVRVAGNKLFVSDGTQTQTFSAGGNPPASLGLAPGVGTTALHALGGNVVAAGGNGRHLRLVDFTIPNQATTLFDYEASSSRGTINRIEAITGAGSKLYAAAGDIGIISVETANFRAPFPLRATLVGSAESVVRTASGIVVAPSTGGLVLYTVNADDSLSKSVSWDSGRVSRLLDAQGTIVASTTGRSVFIWNIAPTSPTTDSSGTFPKNVEDAILLGTSIYALLEDGTVWRADITQKPLVPSLVAFGGVTFSALSRSGNAVAAVRLLDTGNSVIHYWSDGDFSKGAQTKEVEGAATSGVAVTPQGLTAVATFKGLTVVSFPAGSVSILGGILPGRDIAFAGSHVVFATGSSLQIFESSPVKLVASHALPQPAVSLQRGEAGTPFFAATTDGVAAVRVTGAAPVPTASLAPMSNSYFRSMAVAPGKIALLDGSTVETYSIATSGTPRGGNRFSVDPLASDIAADPAHVFIMTRNGRVISYGYGGYEERRLTLPGTDLTALRMRVVAGALHVAFQEGCPFACAFKTAVIDPATLAITATYAGAILDATVSGATAFILVEQPGEVRSVDLRDPLRPVVSSSVASTGNPVSIAHSPSMKSVYVLGAKLYVYDDVSLASKGDLLSAYASDPTGRTSYVDQRIRIVNDCVTIVSRGFAPSSATLAAPATLGAMTPVPTPAAARLFDVVDGTWVYLTDYSLEVYTTKPAGRRRPVR